MLSNVIGLIGPEGAGKSTAAKVLAQRRGYTILPFAKPLKDMMAALGVDERHLYGTPADKAEPLPLLGGLTARHAMQTLGTEWGRECIDENLWVNAWLHKSMALRVGFVVADDVRFLNEVKAIKSTGGTIIRIIKSGDDLNRIPKHASEDFAALPWDFTIINGGSLAQLEHDILAAEAYARSSVPA